ncbi:hypothetical protein BDN67DRAFT_983794 [Paxillus ammoniavirescens]|nr:hypothetical protein BDN67DRAFT_983794 [Paxillus ammoniavirescens]
MPPQLPLCTCCLSTALHQGALISNLLKPAVEVEDVVEFSFSHTTSSSPAEAADCISSPPPCSSHRCPPATAGATPVLKQPALGGLMCMQVIPTHPLAASKPLTTAALSSTKKKCSQSAIQHGRDGKKARRAQRGCGGSDSDENELPAFKPHSSMSKKYTQPKSIMLNLSIRGLQCAKGGYIGVRFWKKEDDSKLRVVVILAGQPGSPTWPSAVKEATEALIEAGKEICPERKDPKPKNLMLKKKNEKISLRLLACKVIQCIAGFANSGTPMMTVWKPPT